MEDESGDYAENFVGGGVEGGPPVKPRPRRPESYKRLLIEKKAERPGRLIITIDVEPKVAEVLYRLRGNSLLKKSLTKALSRLAGPKATKRVRDRTTYLTPQVPREIRDDLKARLKAAHRTDKTLPTTVTELLRKELEVAVEFASGKRKTKRRAGGKPVFRRPEKWAELKERGPVLLRLYEGHLARFSFDAGKAREAVATMIDGMGLSDSEFFSALMERTRDALPPLLATTNSEPTNPTADG